MSAGATPPDMPGGADALLLAVQRLCHAIRCNLPQIGGQLPSPVEVPVFRCDLRGEPPVLPVTRAFADLVHDPPEDLSPDGMIRQWPAVQEVAAALHEVHRLLEAVPEEEGRRLRGLLRLLGEASLYWYHWTGQQGAERDAAGVVRPAQWLLIRQALCPVDGGLLQDINEAARAACDRQPEEAAAPGSHGAPPTANEYAGPACLADRYGVPQAALAARLSRWRRKNLSECSQGWMEAADRGPRQPRYLYRIRTVLPIVEELRRSPNVAREK
jgi:hypothetical protein